MSEDVPHYGPMTEQRAREVLRLHVQHNDSLLGDVEFVDWPAYGDDPEHARLDGEFTAEQLEAIAWWMRNKAPSST